VFTPFHKPPYTYPYGRSVDETTTYISLHLGPYDDRIPHHVSNTMVKELKTA
jgi:hypothetical protein